MKLKLALLSTVLSLGLLTTACTNQELGTVGGGVVGGAAGNVLTGGSAAGTVVGAVGGAFVGNRLSQ